MAAPTPNPFDFIVVGGGTAGNVVAGRLAENPGVKILVIEAGIGNPDDIPEITTPARAFELRNSKYDWSYQTTFVDRPDYERVEKPNTRGKVLGGSSSLNYFTWIRGSRETFDAWQEYGGDEWTWEKCKQYFQKPASYHDDERVYDPHFSKIAHEGPLHISHANLLPETSRFRDALIQAWTSKGHELKEDIYNGRLGGLTHCVSTVYDGVRSSSAVYVTGKDNVEIMHSTVATKINFEGDTAVSVTVIGTDHNETTLKAKNEIIIAGGVFETPKLLLLSGIGPRRELARHGIDPVITSEHVGEHLLDHPILPHVFRLKDGLGLDHILLREGTDHDAAVTQYKKDKTGPLSSGLLEMIAFPRIDGQLEDHEMYRKAKTNNRGKDPFGPEGQPHFEIDFIPMFCDAFQWHFDMPPEGDWLTVVVDLLHPQSKGGHVRLNSIDPREQPDINLNYFTDELDILALREGVRFVDDILMNGDGMKEIIAEDFPWPMSRESDEEMDRLILDRAQTGYHPCGTARLSHDIDQGVVDSELRVHGAKRLRIVDASIIPVIPDCRIQNAVYMIGEKGADIIKAAYPELYK
ncbi:Glucose-methanol-choline oxidoreductase [Penicillium concentricum]|uniref:Glucose-methanol-choline oxidoreductase n=1 Tax=Penicillium concentricum TaxID=293559 RepID=A0A9W9VB72_9EURO|nr:Glucose-methanol-choline oxidoreductase [Penicillium concentricum]KAJ5374289.1 Glucose-methanol-choline oxidoreductase [Penicillium concentricum]